MKQLLFILCIISTVSYGQVSEGYIQSDKPIKCGTWKAKEEITEWVSMDVPNGKFSATREMLDNMTSDDWAYSEWEIVGNSIIFYGLYCHCGCHDGATFVQYRIDKVLGIKQQRFRAISWTYTPPEPTEYELAEQKFYKK